MKKILIATNLGFYAHGMGFDNYLYGLLQKNSYEPFLAICDGVLDACQMSKFSRVTPSELAQNGQSDICRRCFKQALKRSLNSHSKLLLSDFITKDEVNSSRKFSREIPLSDIQSTVVNGLPVGEHAYAAAIRYFANLKFLDDDFGEQVLRKYLSAALVTAKSYQSIFSSIEFINVIAHHGIYVPQGMVIAVARKNKVDIVTWIKTYRKDTFLFSWNDSYHYTMQNEAGDWRYFDFPNRSRKKALRYLNERRTGVNDSIHFNLDPVPISLKDSNKRFLLLTSVFWDAQLHYEGNLFSNQANWILETIDFFMSNQEVGDLIIRIHPAETTGAVASRDKANDRIKKAYSNLSTNITIIDSDSRVSTYDLIDQSDIIIVYNTKTSIEAAAMGKPILIAGDCWVKGTGFDITPTTEEEYFDVLRNSDEVRLSFRQKELALRYFYHFFFRRMFVFNDFIDNPKNFAIDEKKATDLLSHQRESELVFLYCFKNKIPFTYKDELYKETHKMQLQEINTINGYTENTVLHTKDELKFSNKMVKMLDLIAHHDNTKDWDLLGFILTTSKYTNKESTILDAGCGGKAIFGSNLVKVGYKNVYGMDLKERLVPGEYRKQIKYTQGDLNELPYDDNFFDLIGSLSVIEHIGSYEKNIREFARVCKNNGYLIISTDYWATKIDCSGIYPYGDSAPEMKIFSSDEIKDLIGFAKSQGFGLVGKFDPAVVDKACFWERVDRHYTFCRLVFKKID